MGQPARASLATMASQVELTVPADPSFVSLVRAATAAICARADFPIDRLEDLRLAIDEACSIVIADAPGDAMMAVTWWLDGAHVRMRVSARSSSGRPVSTDTFSWTVLTALVDSVETAVDDGRLTLTLTAHGVESVAL